MNGNETNNQAIALHALAWILADEARASRLLALTGLTPDAIRQRVGEPDLLAAVLRFLEGHEPDLVACAGALGMPPLQLVEARRRLEAGPVPRPSLRVGRSRRAR